MIRPRALKPGDHIRVVSPASPLTIDRVERCAAMLASEGYKVTYARHAFSHHGYLSSADAIRAADLMEAFTEPGVDAVLCSRGGYGCARLFPYLDLDTIAQSGRMFAGFSDITTLHTALNRRGLVTFHSPMMVTFRTEREPWVVASFLRALKGEDPLAVDYRRAKCLVPGTAQGRTTGGCLCLINDTLATPEAIDMAHKIVLIEDVGEPIHRVDALLTHLINTGQIQRAAGIVVGEFTSSNEKRDEDAREWTWQEIVKDRLAPLGIPTMTDFPMGHADQMLTIPMGVMASLDAEAGTLTMLESACAA